MDAKYCNYREIIIIRPSVLASNSGNKVAGTAAKDTKCPALGLERFSRATSVTRNSAEGRNAQACCLSPCTHLAEGHSARAPES